MPLLRFSLLVLFSLCFISSNAFSEDAFQLLNEKKCISCDVISNNFEIYAKNIKLKSKYQKCSTDRFLQAILSGLMNSNDSARNYSDFNNFTNLEKTILLMHGEDQYISRIYSIGLDDLECDPRLFTQILHTQRLYNLSLLEPYVNIEFIASLQKDTKISSAFDVIARHSYDIKPKFSEKVLGIYKNLLVTKQIDAISYAGLYDTILYKKLGTQRYGTRGDCDDKGIWHFYPPLESKANLEKYRKEIGYDAGGLIDGVSCDTFLKPK